MPREHLDNFPCAGASISLTIPGSGVYFLLFSFFVKRAIEKASSSKRRRNVDLKHASNIDKPTLTSRSQSSNEHDASRGDGSAGMDEDSTFAAASDSEDEESWIWRKHCH